MARSQDNPQAGFNPARNTPSTDTYNGRVSYIMTRIVDFIPASEQNAVLKAYKMLMPHMLKDFQKVPEEYVERACRFMVMLLQGVVEIPKDADFAAWLNASVPQVEQLVESTTVEEDKRAIG